MIASRGVSAADLDRAAGHFAQRARGEGPASKMMRFAEPLLRAAGQDQWRIDHAFTLAMAFWNLALCQREHYDEMLARMTDTVARDERQASEFHAMAADMVERHRLMFPELHGSRVGR